VILLNESGAKKVGKLAKKDEKGAEKGGKVLVF
jgi:hypothetical protein